MNVGIRQRRSRGYVSYTLVLSAGLILTSMMFYSYRAAMAAHEVQTKVTMRVDYEQKTDAVLRAVVNIVPNRAMLAMQTGSNSSTTNSDPLRWQNIFMDAVTQANARTALSSTVVGGLNLGTVQTANTGDAPMTTISNMFDAIEPESGYVSPDVNRNLGSGFPIPLNCNDATTTTRNATWPIISTNKFYGTLASSLVGAPVATYPQYNLIKYPNIRFGYAQPGQNFVAKRNWWAFSMDLAENTTQFARMPIFERDFILSIYEVPSQLAISASAFTSLGQHASGETWKNANITGGVFSSRTRVDAPVAVQRLAGRRDLDMNSSATVNGESYGATNPLLPGVREQYEVSHSDFMPVSLSSESGRVAFIPISRGVDFFNRFAHSTESNTLSPTTWNQYTVGALQCAMQFDVTDVYSSTNQAPTAVSFSYYKAGVRVSKSYTVNVTTWNSMSPPFPFSVTTLYPSRPCLIVYPQRFPAYLTSLGADSVAVNNSLVVNVNYPANSPKVVKPSYPCLDSDIGLIMKECSNLTSFTKGFSLVTNLRLYIADDFNVTATTPPTGSGLSSPFYPPASLFSPERRYGADVDPYAVKLGGQIANLSADTATTPVRILDLKKGSSNAVSPDQITVNLAPITHPAALPPINMMNWLVVLEERRRELYGEGQSTNR